MNGILLIDKPINYTSFDVVALVRKLIKQKKVGHTGTLDPLATGVLPILIGEATKAQSIIPDTDKEYLASFKLGVTTDTQDITGKVLTQKESNVTYDQVLNVLKDFCGELKQVPPMFSAVKKDGVRLYSLARKGIEVERAPRTITIDKIELVDFNPDTGEGKINVMCSKGTYIRTLCHDIGYRLGTGAVLTALHRTCACGFSQSQTISLDQLKKSVDEKNIDKFIVSTEKLFSCYPILIVSNAQATRFLNGGPLSLNRLSVKKNVQDGSKFCVYNRDSVFLGLGIVNVLTQELQIFKLFKTKEALSNENTF